MKTLYSILAHIIICFPLAHTQGQIYNGNLTVSSQAQADTFPYREVHGQLTIESNITNFSGFDSLELAKILYFKYSKAIQIDGFESLSSLEELVITSSDSLLKINGFSNLDSVNKLTIYGNHKLLEVNGFQNLSKIQYELVISSNHNLLHFDSLHNVTEIGRLSKNQQPVTTTWYEPTITINSCDSLTSLFGLSGLNYHYGGIHLISNAPNLTSIDFLHKMDTINGSLLLNGLLGITDLNDMNSIQVVTGVVGISMDSIQDLEGFSGLKSCGRLLIHHSVGLKKITKGFDSLGYISDGGYGIYMGAYINGYLAVYNNPNLVEINGFKSLSSINGNDSMYQDIHIDSNPLLKSIGGFPELKTISPNITSILIEDNPSLLEISAYPSLKFTAGGIDIINNSNLSKVTGFSNLDSQNTINNSPNILIQDNPNLLSLCGFFNLTQAYPNFYNYQSLYQNNNPNISFSKAIGLGNCDQSNSFYLKGEIFSDPTNNCHVDSTELGLENWFVQATGPTGIHYAITDTAGNYEFWLDTASYSLKIISPTYISPLNYDLTSCDSVKQVNIDPDSSSNIVEDWGVYFPPCPFFVTSFGNTFFRRCFTQNITINYENLGYGTANQSVLVVRKPDLLQILGTSIPYTYGLDSVLIFQLGNIAPGAKGMVTLQTKVPCTSIEHLGIEQCLEAWVETPSYCQPSTNSWNGASLETKSSCFQDSLLLMEIRNTGTSPMSDSSTYRLYSNSTLVQTAAIQLDTVNSLLISIPADQNTYRLEVDQVPSHPFPDLLATALEGCTDLLNSNTSRGQISKFQQPEARFNPSYTSFCRPIIGSYDPNDKKVQPTGLGIQKLVTPGSELTYRIRFQNTGTDTAFTIQIVDTLDQNLDPTTFYTTSSSHPYSVSFSGTSQTVVNFLFDNIQLPDSNVNEPASNGYIEFRIKPKSAAVAGTCISNFADIYFDFNPPIRTDTTTTNWGIYSFPTLISPHNTLLSNQAPGAPSLLSVQDSIQNYSILTWKDHSTTELGFLVMLSVNDTVSFVVIDSLPANAQHYLDTIIFPGKIYYRVAAFSLGGISDPTNIDSVYTPVPVPPTPTILSINDTILETVTFTWMDTSYYEVGFIIQRSTDSVTYVSIDSVKQNITSYTDSLPMLDQTYWYRVLAHNFAGNSAPSDTFSVFQATPIPTSPHINFTDTSTLFAPIIGWIAPNYYESGFLIQRSLDSVTFSTLDSVTVGISTYQDSISALEKAYWYRIIAFNHNGNSLPSDTARIFQLTPPPLAPTGLSIDTSTLFEPVLSWTKPDYFEDGFIIERSTDGQPFSARDTIWGQIYSYMDTLQALYSPVTYQVRAFNHSGNSGPSNLASVTQKYPVPASPTTLQAVLYEDLTAELSWDHTGDFEYGFILEKKEAIGTFSVVDTIAKNVTTYLDGQEFLETNYTYRVKASNPTGPSGYSNEVLVNHSRKVPPAPDSLVIVGQQGIFPVLEWKDNSVYEEGYILERSDNNQDFIPFKLLSPNQSVTTDSSLSGNGSYQYRVFAYNQLGNSGYSNVVNYSLTTSIGIQESAFTRFQILPNPFTDNILIRHEGNPVTGHWEISNVLGKSILNDTSVFGAETSIPLPDLPAGTYFLQIDLKEGSNVWKVQKQ